MGELCQTLVGDTKDDDVLRLYFLFVALIAILFSRANPIVQY